MTAEEAVVKLVPLFRPKAVEERLRYPVQSWTVEMEIRNDEFKLDSYARQRSRKLRKGDCVIQVSVLLRCKLWQCGR